MVAAVDGIDLRSVDGFCFTDDLLVVSTCCLLRDCWDEVGGRALLLDCSGGMTLSGSFLTCDATSLAEVALAVLRRTVDMVWGGYNC